MKGCLIIYWMVLQFIPDIIGVLVNSPCTKTSDWSNYHIRCPTNHTIYITKHVIEDGFTKLKFPALGCSIRDAVYCGVELPNNNTINHKNYHILESAVKTCNGRNECTLTKKYFLDAKAALKKYCNASLRPELQEATFRQSIDYQCIPDSQITDMCLAENESRHFNQPVYLKASNADCTCNITGSIACAGILQTMSVKLLIESNDRNIFEHQNSDVSLYGVDIPVQAENLIITIQEVSNTSLVLMKVLNKGNISIQCHLKDGIKQNKEYSTTELLKVNSNFNGQVIEDTAPFLTTMNTPFNFTKVITGRFFTRNFDNSTKTELKDLHGIANIVKSWMRSLIVIVAVVVLLVIFLILISIFIQRKDRILLLTILKKLDDRCSDTIKQNSGTEFSHSRLSEDDKTYHEISKQNLCHSNTKRFTNPVYETECMVLENAGVEQNDVGDNVTSLESNDNCSMLVNSDPHGVYELQKIV